MTGEVIQHLELSDRVEASVVIPHYYESREKNLEGLLEDLRTQTFQAVEIIVVRGMSPQGRAINEGVRRARGEVLVVIDDDSRLGNAGVVENLVRVIRDDPSVGMVGASVVSSRQANKFQRLAARQFPRFEMPIVKEVVDSDLPGHPCTAFPKKVFEEAGMEREDILRGLDPDLRVRIRKAGYRVVLAPDTWIHHPLPDNIWKFIRVFLRNGYGSAYLQRFYPEICYDTDEAVESGQFVAKRSLLWRILRYPLRLVRALTAFQWIRFLGYAVYLIGYLAGLIRFSFQSRSLASSSSLPTVGTRARCGKRG